MSETEEAGPRRSGRPILVLSIVAAAALGGGGFLAAYTGFVPMPGGSGDSAPQVAFVAIEPLVISLHGAEHARHLRFGASIEVDQRHRAEVERLMPRILDVMNGYLRAIGPEEVTAQGALVRLRAHLLRRIQLVSGEGRVRDLLVTEFVIN